MRIAKTFSEPQFVPISSPESSSSSSSSEEESKDNREVVEANRRDAKRGDIFYKLPYKDRENQMRLLREQLKP